MFVLFVFCFFFFNDTATTEIYTLSLHDALPISRPRALSEPTGAHGRHGLGGEHRGPDLRRGAARRPLLPPEHALPAAPTGGRLRRVRQRHRDRGARDSQDARPAEPRVRKADRTAPRADRGGHPAQLLADRRRSATLRPGRTGHRASSGAGRRLTWIRTIPAEFLRRVTLDDATTRLPPHSPPGRGSLSGAAACPRHSPSSRPDTPPS